MGTSSAIRLAFVCFAQLESAPTNVDFCINTCVGTVAVEFDAIVMAEIAAEMIGRSILRPFSEEIDCCDMWYQVHIATVGQFGLGAAARDELGPNFSARIPVVV